MFQIYQRAALDLQRCFRIGLLQVSRLNLEIDVLPQKLGEVMLKLTDLVSVSCKAVTGLGTSINCADKMSTT